MAGQSGLVMVAGLLLCAGQGSGCRARPGEAEFAAARQAFAASARGTHQDPAPAEKARSLTDAATRSDAARVDRIIDTIGNGHEGTAGVILSELQRNPRLTAQQQMALHGLARVLQARLARRLVAGDPQAEAERNLLHQALAPR